MTIKPRFDGATPLGDAPSDRRFRDDVWAGLSATPKSLPAKYFYDAEGSALFEAITRQPEYYPTRTEFRILEEQGSEIAAALPARASLVEFGSGSTAKVRRLIAHRPDLAAYVPVDVSESFLLSEAEALRADFPHLSVRPVAADFARAFALPPTLPGEAVAGYFPGSTIGNFEPEEAVRLLAGFGQVLGPGATLIVGVDLVKDGAVLDAAYNDAAGVTAAFNRNLLARIGRELGGDLDPAAFSHRAFFDAAASRVEMHLVSREAQEVAVAGRRFTFAAGETIHTENSYKYTVDGFRALAAGAGWAAGTAWTDPDGLFSVHALVRA